MIRTIMNCLVSQKGFKSQDIRNITFTRPKITKFLAAVSKLNCAGVGGTRDIIWELQGKNEREVTCKPALLRAR